MERLKVYYGSTIYKGGQFFVCVAAPNMKEVARIMRTTVYDVRNMWSECCNDEDIAKALSSPGRIAVIEAYDRRAREIPIQEVVDYFGK